MTSDSFAMNLKFLRAGFFLSLIFFSLSIARAQSVCGSLEFTKGTTVAMPATAGPDWVSVADFNNDGKADLVIADFDSNFLYVRLGNGTDGFTTPAAAPIAPLPAGYYPTFLAANDFNGDGKKDVAVAGIAFAGSAVNTTTGRVAVALGDGTGGFTVSATLSFNAVPGWIETADFTGDGKVDLAVVNNGSGQLNILQGNGAGSFSLATGSPIALAAGLVSVASLDFNRDGKRDLVVSNKTAGVLYFLQGNGAGVFTQVGTAGVPQAGAVAVGDFNSDGRDDIAIVGKFSSNTIIGISILLDDGAGGFIVKLVNTTDFAADLKIKDFDNDGKQDIGMVSTATGTARVLRGAGDGTFSIVGPITLSTANNPAYSMGVGDFNSDGKLDFATDDYLPQTVNIFLNSCNYAPTITTTPASVVTSAPGTVANLATVADSDQSAGTLTVKVNNATSATVNNITVSGLTINAAGVVSGTIAAICGATTTTFTLTVTDSKGASTNASLTITPTDTLTIILAPANKSVTAGTITSFAAGAAGATSVQWQISTNGGQFWTDVQGANTTSLSVKTTAAHNGYRYRAVFMNCGSKTITSSALLTVTSGTAANTLGLVISEFRLRGNSSQAQLDEYVELFNNTNADITVPASGWEVACLNAAGTNRITLKVLSAGLVIPAKSHYLITNNSANGYSLGTVAAGDATFTTDMPDDGGVAIFNTVITTSISSTMVIDAVGFQQTSTLASIFREGTGLSNLGATNGEYAWVRKMQNGSAIDTGNNANDFILVTPSGNAINSVASVIGIPGPENSASPGERNNKIYETLFDPLSASNIAPNQVRDTTPITNGTFGTLVLRRTFTNNTGVPLKQLRFRVIDVTNAAASATDADVRILSSVASTINGQNVQGITLEQPATQTNGGGFNSTFAVGTITAAQPIAAGATVNVEFKLGVVRKGKYRIFFNIEAAP